MDSDLMKRKEEQDEKLMAHKTYQAKLLKQQVAAQSAIDGQLKQLEELNQKIKESRQQQDHANN